MLKLTWPQAAAWRLSRQHLDKRARPGSLLAVAQRLCGLHAQVMSSAELTVWARVEGLDCTAVQKALWDERSLVKTWAMRGTLHLLPSTELSLWHAALGINGQFMKAVWWQRNFGITLDQLDRITDAIAEALGGRLLTRDALAAEVARISGVTAFSSHVADNSWGTILRPAAFTGRLCFGPSLGQRVQFTRPDTWLAKPAESLDAPTATAEVTRRFLDAYGPATHVDLARWWGGANSITTARKWLQALGDEVTPVDLEGVSAWMLTRHARRAREIAPARSVRLLPGFDQYVVAASPHAEHLLPGDLRGRIYRPQGWISPVLLVNGRMEGVWRHELKGSRVEVTVDPFRKPPVWVRRAAAQEAERLAEFFGGKLKLEWRS